MTTTNNTMIIHNQDEIRDHPSTPPPPIYFGNVLTKFPSELLLQLLPYIADRIVWNSIASSNKDIYEKSKQEAYQPPWPINFKLCIPGDGPHKIYSPVWSPDGTQIACFVKYGSEGYRIVIFDQRRGLLQFHRHGDDVDNSDIGWIPHEASIHLPNLKFSSDGNYLLSCNHVDDGDDEIVKIWDYNTTGYYQQLQEWNVGREINRPRIDRNIIDISPCSRYVVVLSNRHVLLKDVQNNGKTIKSMLLPEMEKGRQIIFSSFDGHHSIFIRSQHLRNKKSTIRIWRPFDDFRTFLKHTKKKRQHLDIDFAVSRDNSMIAICITEEGKDRTMIYNLNSTLSLKQSFSGLLMRYWSSIQFTPDGKYLSYCNQNGVVVFFNLITGNEVTDQMNLSYSTWDNKCLTVFGFSPVGCGPRFLIKDKAYGGCYITSFWENGSTVQNNCKEQERSR